MKSFHSRDELVERQRQRLLAMLDSTLPANRFYQSRLSACGPWGKELSLDAILRSLPLTTKTDLTEDHRRHSPFGSHLTYPVERYTRCHQTSGTGGFSLRWLDTPESWDWMLSNWAQVYEAAGVTAEDRIYFAFSFGPFLGFWTAFESAVRLGCLCFPAGGLSSVARARGIVESSATVLCCTPTYALHLGETLRAEKLEAGGLSVRRILVAGEPGGSLPATRRRIESLWKGASVHDHHGMTEIGPVTYQCPRQPGVLHVMEDAFIPEILDRASNAPVPPGTPGELILTNLGRLGSPLLRYRTGDLAQAAPLGRCVCGTFNLALQGGILGRIDDMVTVRGVNLYPSSVDEVIQRVAPQCEYQVHVHSSSALAEARVRLESSETATERSALAGRLEAELRNAFCLRFEIEWVEAGTLPRAEHKSRRWIRDDAPSDPPKR
ncbi:MAG: AMP-binding protein [Verrucomicrobia bacterium]|nr:AMP-binding protein [Verrucomicrobiota bacterium]